MIRVTYWPMELSVPDVKDFEQANRYYIHEDNTLELRFEYEDKNSSKKRFRKIAHVHPDRWRDVEMIEVEIEEEEETDAA